MQRLTGVIDMAATSDWRTDLESLMKNFHEQAKIDRRRAVEADNALAEELGYACHLDPRRGHGYCRFSKGNVEVWETASNGRVWWMRAQAVPNRYSSLYFRNQTFFERKEDALRNENPYARLGRYGMMERIRSDDGDK